MSLRKQILVVEDRAEIRKLIQMATQRLPYDIHEASNGADGLRQALERRPDLLLLDIMMPGDMDGLAVCRALKADPRTASIPVVLLTALAQESDRTQGAEAGADDYLSKPFSIAELIATIQRFIAMPPPPCNPTSDTPP